MNTIKKNIVPLIVILSLITMTTGVVIWNKIVDKQNNEKDKQTNVIDVSDVNNIDSIESKLGNPIKITQNYLLTYTTNKSGTWYMSSAYVKKITINDNNAMIEFTDENKKFTLVGNINKDKLNIEKGDFVNFVGSIDLSTGYFKLSKVSKDTINYKSVTTMDFIDLINNIQDVLSNEFIINGYMVTDGDKYKLYDSKSDYKKDGSVGTYFTIIWDNDFNYTGNANITISCNIGGTFKLKNCSMIES